MSVIRRGLPLTGTSTTIQLSTQERGQTGPTIESCIMILAVGDMAPELEVRSRLRRLTFISPIIASMTAFEFWIQTTLRHTASSPGVWGRSLRTTGFRMLRRLAYSLEGH